jgi:predicted phosphodiesterase
MHITATIHSEDYMKFLVSSDWHLRTDKPRCRVDDWMTTQRERLEWLVTVINQHSCPMYVAGDIMDSGTANPALENMIISVLKKAEYPIKTIAGNHDVLYHNIKHLEKSSYWVLHQAGVIDHQPDEKECVTAFQYGEEITNNTGIMMCHRLVFPNTPPPYLKNAISAKELLNQYDYDIILSGDNHMAFYTEHNGKVLINGGGLFRQEANEKYKVPKIYLYEDGVITTIEVPVNVEDVQQEYLLEEHARLDRMTAFVERVEVSHDLGLSFTDNIEASLKTTTIQQPTIEIIYKALRGELID